VSLGLIVAASIIVAAGIAFYENEHIRQWIDTYRQKIAMALHSLGDEISPPSRSPEEDEEARRRRRESIIRHNQLELVRRAREEGVAVDLDELAAVATTYDAQHPEERRSNPNATFDDLVGSDGMLRDSASAAAASTTATAAASDAGLRQRGAGARGFASGTGAANPFDDDAQVLFDHALIGLHDADVWSQASGDTARSRTLSAAATADPQSPYKSDAELAADIAEAIRRSLADGAPAASAAAPAPDPPTSVPASAAASPFASLLLRREMHESGSAVSPALASLLLAAPDVDGDEDGAPSPPGTLTPTEDTRSAASVAGSGGDVGLLAEVESWEGSEDGRASEAFSVVGGESAPSEGGSWTDVESLEGEEEGRHGA